MALNLKICMRDSKRAAFFIKLKCNEILAKANYCLSLLSTVVIKESRSLTLNAHVMPKLNFKKAFMKSKQSKLK